MAATTSLYPPLSAVAAPGDVYALQETSPDDFNLNLPQIDEESGVTDHYYKLTMMPDNFNAYPGVTWSEIPVPSEPELNIVTVSLPNKDTRYFQFTSAPQPGQTVYHNQQSNLSGDLNVHISDSYGDTYGGALQNTVGKTLGNINGSFVNNHSDYGGAIYNQGDIGLITADFIGNNAQTYNPHPHVNDGFSASHGGAIYNSAGDTESDAHIAGINGNFIGNYVDNPKDLPFGGAIYNSSYGDKAYIGDINGHFIGNYLTSERDVHGGAIMNDGKTGKITGNFLRNHTEVPGDTKLFALGGAVALKNDTTFAAAGQPRFFSENYTQDQHRGKLYNAVFVNNFWAARTPLVTFDTTGGGAWIINDNIEGGSISGNNGDMNYTPQYALLFKGDDTVNPATGLTAQYVAVNNDIINAKEITVEGTTLRFGSYQHEDKTAQNWDGRGSIIAALNADGTANREAEAVTSLNLRNNGVFHIANNFHETIRLKNLSSDNGFMHIDVNPDQMTADVLNINGNVEGVKI